MSINTSPTVKPDKSNRQSEENLTQINSRSEVRGTGSLIDLDTCSRIMAGSSFVPEPSAFTLPHSTQRLFLPNQEGTHSLPLPRGNATDKVNAASSTTTEQLRKTHSSVSLTSIPDGPYNDIWVGSITLRRTAKPNLENERHRENSLRLSILEARNLSSKRRYYCDICLDRTLYARTTSKTANASIFWAEDFDLNNLPNVSVMTISLYKEVDAGGKELRRFGTARMSAKKMRKSQNQLIGFITVPMAEITGRNDIQVWLTLQPPVDSVNRDMTLFHLASSGVLPNARNPFEDSGRLEKGSVLQSSNSFTSLTGRQHSGSLTTVTANGTTSNSVQRNMPQIRIRARYRSVDVLPHRDYWALKAFLLEHSLLLSNWLDTTMTVKTKEEVASSLVGLHECNGTLVKFLTDLVVSEVSHLDNDSMAFRSNTVATKAVEYFVKLVGSTYLHNLLYGIVQKVLTCLTAWEVNPEKLPSSTPSSGSLTVSDTATFAKTNDLDLSSRPAPGSLKANQLQLLRYLNVVWRAIQASSSRFPSSLIRVFSSFRSAIEPQRGAEFCDNLISGCIFLRLICPALLSPSLFGLVSAFPSEPWCQRNLTLLAKSLQSLANFTAFDDKEPYMRFLNGYVSAEMPQMRAFIRTISTWPTVTRIADDPDTAEGFRDVVDEGFELANLHLLLTEHLNQPDEDTQSNATLDRGNQTLTSTRCLPDALSPLSSILDELTKRMNCDESLELGTTRSLTRYQTTASGTSDRSPDPTDRLHVTLPSKHRKRGLGRNTTECLFQSDGSKNTPTSDSLNATNMYAYHASGLTNSIPFYTLHQNPGFHRPSAGGNVTTGAVNLLSADPSFTADGTRSQLVTPSMANPNDYDEPYVGVQSDSDRECDPQPESKSNGKMHAVSLDHLERSSGLSSFGPSVELRKATRTSTTHHIEPTIAVDDEPIYDIVPVSDDSSTDELVDTNERYLQYSESATTDPPITTRIPTDRPSLTLLLNEDRCFKPVRLPSAEDRSLDSISFVEEKSDISNRSDVRNTNTSIRGTQVERPNTIRMDQTHQASLSPRLMPKQVTTASVVLITPSSPTKTVESPTVNIHPVPANIPLDVHDSQSRMKDKTFSNRTGIQDTTSPARQEFKRVEDLRNGINSPIRNNQQVTRTYSDLDAYKESGWTGRTSSSNSLTSIRTAGPSESDLMIYPMPSSECLQSEVIRLRQQLQLSQEDAARAANRLSQQEAELVHLRQLLEQMRTKNVGSLVPNAHTYQRKASVHMNPHTRAETSISSVSDTSRMFKQRNPIGEVRVGKSASSVTATSTTKSTTNNTMTIYEELDDAVAK